jgi:hypothetical protein
MKRAKANLAVLLQADITERIVEDAVESLGAWMTPLDISVPEGVRNGVGLRAAVENALMGSFGAGDLCVADGTLFRVGFRARAPTTALGTYARREPVRGLEERPHEVDWADPEKA